MDGVTINKSRPSCARVKVQIDLLAERHNFLMMEIENEITKEIKSVKVKIKYGMIPSYCERCKLQGLEEEDYRILHPELRINGSEAEKELQNNQEKYLRISRSRVD